MEKLRADDLTGVSETLLIPLHYRVEASKAEASSFKDDIAERFHEAVAYDWEKFGETALRPVQRLAMAARTAILDDQVKAFIAKSPDAVVVNLGAGLDTRFYRLDNGRIKWIEIDLPPVIAFREKLGEPSDPRQVLLAASVFDEQRWAPTVKEIATSHILFVAEGLFPYFTKEQHKSVFGSLADDFSGQEMLFQTNAPSLLQPFVQHSELPRLRTKVELQWGLEEGTQVSSINPKVRFIREFPLLTEYEKLPIEIRRQMSSDRLHKVGKIIHVRFEYSVPAMVV